jgi:DNA repair exonuclease SbcCD ATPase subunit
MRRKSGSAGPPQAPMEVDREALERARLARELALEDLSDAKRKLGEAARQLAERERKLTEREDGLEARVRRIARKLEARRRRQHRIDALRGRFAERDFVKGKQRKESQLARGEARLEERESELVRRSAHFGARFAWVP